MNNLEKYLDQVIDQRPAVYDAPPDEPGAANVLRLGETICLHSGFARTIDLLDGLSYRLNPVDISELIKAESGVTCSSIIIKT